MKVYLPLGFSYFAKFNPLHASVLVHLKAYTFYTNLTMKIYINFAFEEQLRQFPSIGEVRASKLVKFRSKHGHISPTTLVQRERESLLDIPRTEREGESVRHSSTSHGLGDPRKGESVRHPSQGHLTPEIARFIKLVAAQRYEVTSSTRVCSV